VRADVQRQDNQKAKLPKMPGGSTILSELLPASSITDSSK